MTGLPARHHAQYQAFRGAWLTLSTDCDREASEARTTYRDARRAWSALGGYPSDPAATAMDAASRELERTNAIALVIAAMEPPELEDGTPEEAT